MAKEGREMKAYRIKGTTDDVTDCELCGKSHLKGTVILEALDADGSPKDVVYFGRICAGKAAGWTQREVTQKIKEAKVADATRRRNEAIAQRDAETRAYKLWVTATYSVSDVKRIGTLDLWAEFRALNAQEAA